MGKVSAFYGGFVATVNESWNDRFVRKKYKNATVRSDAMSDRYVAFLQKTSRGTSFRTSAIYQFEPCSSMARCASTE